MKANTKMNLNYYDVNHYLKISSEIEIGSKEWHVAIKKAGYRYRYTWINSDENWFFFAKTLAQAKKGAAELFAKKKNVILSTVENILTNMWMLLQFLK